MCIILWIACVIAPMVTHAVPPSDAVQPSFSSQTGSMSQPSDSTVANPVEQVQRRGAEVLELLIDRSAARVAEPIQLRLRFEAAGGTQVTFADLQQSLESWSLGSLQTTADLPVDGSDLRRWQWEWSIESFQTGQQAIPPLVVTYQLPGQQQTQQIGTEAVSLEIVSVLQPGDEPTKPRAIKGPAEVANAAAQPSWDRWGWIGVGGLLLVIAFWRFKNRRRKVDAIALAMEQVLAVESACQQKAISVGESYEHLAGILRALVQVQWGLPVSAASSEELVLGLRQRLRSEPDMVETIERLREFLELCDRFRFGGKEGMVAGIGNDTAAAQAVADARMLIQKLGEPPARPSEQLRPSEGGDAIC